MAQAKSKSKRHTSGGKLAKATFDPIILNDVARNTHENSLKSIALQSRIAFATLEKTKPQLADMLVALAKDGLADEFVEQLASARNLAVQMSTIFDMALSRLLIATHSARVG